MSGTPCAADPAGGQLSPMSWGLGEPGAGKEPGLRLQHHGERSTATSRQAASREGSKEQGAGSKARRCSPSPHPSQARLLRVQGLRQQLSCFSFLPPLGCVTASSRNGSSASACLRGPEGLGIVLSVQALLAPLGPTKTSTSKTKRCQQKI